MTHHDHDDEAAEAGGHDHMHFECCDEVFHGREAFEDHWEETHPGEDFQCGCGESFEELEDWTTHVDEEHGGD